MMAVVWVPGLLREFTSNLELVTVPGTNVREVIDALDELYPGLKARLVENGRLRASIAVAVDGEIRPLKLRAKVSPDSQIHFLPAISGG